MSFPLRQKPFSKAIEGVQRGRELLKGSQSLVFWKWVSWKGKFVSWKGKCFSWKENLAKVAKQWRVLLCSSGPLLKSCMKQTQEEECEDFCGFTSSSMFYKSPQSACDIFICVGFCSSGGVFSDTRGSVICFTRGHIKGQYFSVVARCIFMSFMPSGLNARKFL